MKKITLGEYIIEGNLGAWAKSFENKIKIGDVRVIGKVLMSVWMIYRKCWKKDEVWWTPVDEKFNTPENARQWVNNL